MATLVVGGGRVDGGGVIDEYVSWVLGWLPCGHL